MLDWTILSVTITVHRRVVYNVVLSITSTLIISIFRFVKVLSTVLSMDCSLPVSRGMSQLNTSASIPYSHSTCPAATQIHSYTMLSRKMAIWNENSNENRVHKGTQWRTSGTLTDSNRCALLGLLSGQVINTAASIITRDRAEQHWRVRLDLRRVEIGTGHKNKKKKQQNCVHALAQHTHTRRPVAIKNAAYAKKRLMIKI